MPYRWPTDPPGRPPRHTRPYAGGQGAQGPQNLGRGNLLRKVKPPAATPRPAAPRPAAPAAPAAPVGAGIPRPLPVDPIFDQTLSQLAANRDTTLAGLSSQRKQGLGQYGYTEGPTGALTFDPRNPFSKAAELKRLYDVNRRSAGQQMARTGGLYTGAYQNAQDLGNRNELGAQDAMQKALAGFLAQNTSAQAAAGTTYRQGIGTATAERLGRIPENPLYSPTIPAPKPKAAPKAAPKPKAAGKPKSGPRPTPAQVAAGRRRARAKARNRKR